MKKKLLHLVNLDTLGGVEQLFVAFIENSKNLSHQLFVTGEKIYPSFLERLKKANVSISYEKYALNCKLPKFMRPTRRQQILKKPFHSTILWNRLEECKTASNLVYYEHGASWMTHKEANPSALMESCEKLLVNSNASKRLIELKWGIKKPITIIENPLRTDLEIALHPRESIHSPFRIGFIGRLIPHKACLIAVEVVRILNAEGYQVELYIAGTGPEKNRLVEQSKNLPVYFLGAIDEVTSFYDSIDLLFVPSIREPLGLLTSAKIWKARNFQKKYAYLQ